MSPSEIAEARAEHLRTINVHVFDDVAFFAIVALPGINKLHAVNTLDNSTPAASTILNLSSDLNPKQSVGSDLCRVHR
jgi:hypothetical protein